MSKTNFAPVGINKKNNIGYVIQFARHQPSNKKYHNVRLCTLDFSKMAKQLHMSRKTMQRTLNSLNKKGYIKLLNKRGEE